MTGSRQDVRETQQKTRSTSDVSSVRSSLSEKGRRPSIVLRKSRRRLWGDNLLVWMTICGVVLGIILGILCRFLTLSETTLTLLTFPGEILMRLLKMFILPLIVTSLIAGMTQLDVKLSGKMGLRTLVYYLLTTIVAIIIGITLVYIIEPGDFYTADDENEEDNYDSTVLDTVQDIFRNLFPDNLMRACFQQARTVVHVYKVDNTTNRNVIESNLTENSKVTKELVYNDGTNILGLTLFSIVFSLIAKQLKYDDTIVKFFIALNEVIMEMVTIVMWFSPIGIMCLIAERLLTVESLSETARKLGLYVVTVLLGLAIHAVIVLPSIFFAITRINPARYVKGMLHAWATALGTGSSAAALPVTFQCLEDNNGIDKRVTRFVVAVGATMNIDGAALYEAVAAVFIAQMNGVNLELKEIIIISIAVTLTSIGASSSPTSALVTMQLVISTLGLPTSNVALLFAVDWLLDRIRTSINVVGDGFAAGIIHHMCIDELLGLE